MKSGRILPMNFFPGNGNSIPDICKHLLSEAKSLYRRRIRQLFSGKGPRCTLSTYSVCPSMLWAVSMWHAIASVSSRTTFCSRRLSNIAIWCCRNRRPAGMKRWWWWRDGKSWHWSCCFYRTFFPLLWQGRCLPAPAAADDSGRAPGVGCFGMCVRVPEGETFFILFISSYSLVVFFGRMGRKGTARNVQGGPRSPPTFTVRTICGHTRDLFIKLKTNNLAVTI